MADSRSITQASEGRVLLSLESVVVSDCPFGGLWLETDIGGMQVPNETINKLLTDWVKENF